MFFIRCVLLVGLSSLCTPFCAQSVFSPHALFKLQQVSEAILSPDGEHIAYSLTLERPISEGKGSDYRELHLLHVASGKSRPFITGKHTFRSLQWSPDGKQISFIGKMGMTSRNQVFGMPIDGGAPQPLTDEAAGILSYSWHPTGKKLAYVALRSPGGGTPSGLVRLGFDAEIYEEGLNYRLLFVHDLTSGRSLQMTNSGAIYDFAWSPTGDRILAQIAPQNLVDDSYMFKKLNIIDFSTGKTTQLIDNPGKLTSMAWSPDGNHIAFVSAVDISDPVSGSLYIISSEPGQSFSKARNYTDGFEGSVKTASWLDEETVLYASDESVDITLSSIRIGKKKRKILLEGGQVIFSTFQRSEEMLTFVGNTPSHPGEVYTFDMESQELTQQTDHNPWLQNIQMGRQEKISYKARDGLRIDGVLIYPVNYQEGQRYPLLNYIHGGPESCVKNGWATRYSMWGQIAAGQGYFVFMPNYRASSGRGVAYAKADHMDLGDEEFNDVLDGMDYLVEQGMVDNDRIGIGGGSYGGYFSAWAATKHTDRFAASVVFVGISNQISKRNCTDIPYEDYHVHWRIWTYEDVDLIYDRSPVKYAKGSKTPTLVLHGKEDPRVIPTQSLELYRQLKMHGDAPVRLVWYPGEGHGNRNNPAQLDYAIRTMDWFNYYLKGNNDRSEMPSKDLDYGLEQLK
ncbi:MAG: S9 family peptidase [Bacteroidota bacterium]